jgi:hypothetical protein
LSRERGTAVKPNCSIVFDIVVEEVIEPVWSEVGRVLFCMDDRELQHVSLGNIMIVSTPRVSDMCFAAPCRYQSWRMC